MLLDLTKDKCPITFVKTKVALEKLGLEDQLTVKINEGEDLDSMKKSLGEIGFQIIKTKLVEKGIFEIIIKKLNN